MTEVLFKVFKKNEKDKFSEKSLLYQNILLSFLEYPNRFYKTQEIVRKLYINLHTKVQPSFQKNLLAKKLKIEHQEFKDI